MVNPNRHCNISDVPRKKGTRSVKSSTDSSKFSTSELLQVIERFQNRRHKKSTKKTYLAIWRKFNEFVIRLDELPKTWEKRIILYIGHLLEQGCQSATIKTYVSAIKAVLEDDGCELELKDLKISSLTRACRLYNDRVKNRLPIKKPLLELILYQVPRVATDRYFILLIRTIFILAYYGLLRIGELTAGDHNVKARDIHVAENKNKILIMLFSSKTHGKYSRPQTIKIWSEVDENKLAFSPFRITNQFMKERGGYLTDEEPLLILHDRTPIKAVTVRAILKKIIKRLGLNHKYYNTHSFRIGRATDLMDAGFSIDQIKRLGRWRSNAVFSYIRGL